LSHGGDCLSFVCRHIRPIVGYYTEAVTAQDYGVREAACHSIGELGLKVVQPVLLPFVTQLLQSILNALEDPSWAVRSAAW